MNQTPKSSRDQEFESLQGRHFVALHGQVEIDDGVARITCDDELVMLRRERRAYCRSEPLRLSRLDL